ncbi:MAG: DUF742 domain-containing protein [Labedaea sp.]
MSEEPGSEETFAEVVNGLTLGGRRNRPALATRATEPPPACPDPPVAPAWPEPDRSVVDGTAVWERNGMAAGYGPDAGMVRPYSWTGGRTRSSVDLRIEALVTTTERGDDTESLGHTEHRAVADLCREPRSVAEVATLLGVPLGVAKVLLGDMATLGLVVVHRTTTGGANKAHLRLMERVLSGLRRL